MSCGIIYSAEFAGFLQRKQAAEARAHPGEVLSLEYVRFLEGERAGTAWWQLVWVPANSAPAEHRFQIGGTEVFIHRQSRRGLKHHLLHFADGQVVVKG